MLKLKENVVCKSENNILTMEYKPSFVNAKADKIRVKSAVIRVEGISRDGNAVLNLIDCYGTTIDKVKALKNGAIYVDVTKTLRKALEEKNDAITISMCGDDDNSISLSEDYSGTAFVDYVPRRFSPQSNVYKQNNAGRAGSGAVNLSTGDLKFAHSDATIKDGALAVNIAHTYVANYGAPTFDTQSKWDFGDYGDYIMNFSHCGKGWKLNVHQRLYKKTYSELEDNVARTVVYVDGDNNHHIFEEKYYYVKDDGTKQYLPFGSINESENGELYYAPDDTGLSQVSYSVKTEVDSASDLQLKMQKEGFNNIRVLQTNVEEIETLQAQLREVDLAIEQSALSLKSYNANLDYYEKQKAETEDKTEIEKQEGLVNDNIAVCKKTLAAYELQKEKIQRQLNILHKQVSVNFITDSDGRVFGFAKSMESVSDFEEFRLVMIADRWGNAISFEYDDNDNISRLINSEDESVVFKYDEYGEKLISMTDCNGRMTRYGYNSGTNDACLRLIEYPDGSFSRYEYTAGNLIAAIDPRGYSVHYEYNEEGQVAKISESTSTKSIDGDGIKPLTESDEANPAYGDTLTITYLGRKTNVEDSYGNKLTYLFDGVGTPICVYDSKVSEIEPDSQIFDVKSFAYSDSSRTITVKPLPERKNLLEGQKIVINDGGQTQESEYKYLDDANLNNLYVDDENQFGDNVQLEYNSVTKYHKYVLNADMPGENGERTLTCTVPYSVFQQGSVNKKKLVLSAWVKAKSFSVCINDNTTDVKESDYVDVRDLYAANTSDFQKKTRFCLKATLGYTKPVTRSVTLDWTNDEWQFCAIPIFLDEPAGSSPDDITLCLDYSNNKGILEICALQLCEADWTWSYYSKYGVKTSEYSSDDDKTFLTYEYDDDKRIVKSMINKPVVKTTSVGFPYSTYDVYPTQYEYNGAGALVRTTDYNGLVTEQKYNDKGFVVQTLTYHKDEPMNKLYSETVMDDKGNETGAVNEFGDTVSTYTYDKETDLKICDTDKDGNKIAYSYNKLDDSLQGITASVDGIANRNVISYTAGLPTKYEHGGASVEYKYDGFGRNIGVSVCGNKYAEKSYAKSNDGEENTVSYANGAAYTTVTDKDGNVINTRYNGNEITMTEYDSQDRVVKNTDWTLLAIERTEYAGDNVTKKTYSSDSMNYATEMTYNDLNRVQESITTFGDHEPRRTAYGYESSTPDIKLKNMELADGTEQYVYFDKLGRVSEIKHTHYSKQYSYKQIGDRTSNLIASEWFGKNGMVKERLHYTYDEKGNITAIKEGNCIIAKYSYDALGRLTREDNKKLDKTFVITYDCNGNILSKTEYPYTLTDTMNLDNGITYAYDYPTSGWKDKLCAYNGVECGDYDALGNPRSYRGATLTWSHGRRLDQIARDENTVRYRYNAGGIRISKTVNGDETKFYMDGTTVLAQETREAITYFNRGIDGLVSMELEHRMIQEHSVYFYKRNMLGDIIALVNTRGEEIARYVYDAWGNHKIMVLEDGNYVEEPTTQLGKGYKSIAQSNPYRYRGYYYDVESGLYYLNTRYYDPEVGRFINADDISEADPETLNGLNLFAYCYNNPVNMVDDNGNKPKWWQKLLLGLGILVGAVLFAVAVVASGGAVAALAGTAAATVGLSAGAVSAVATVATVGTYAVAAGIGIMGLSDAIEVWSDGVNPVRDWLMNGNQKAYDITRTVFNVLGSVAVFMGSIAPDVMNYVSMSGRPYFSKGKVVGFTKTFSGKNGWRARIDASTHGNPKYHHNPHIHFGNPGSKGQAVEYFWEVIIGWIKTIFS